MGQVRSDFDEIRVAPTLDFAGIEPGRVIDIPDEDVYHWVAGGYTALTRYPVPHRLYPNHRGDPLAYPLPAPPDEDPSVIAVGEPQDTAPPQPPVPAATAPAAAPDPTAAAAAASAKE